MNQTNYGVKAKDSICDFFIFFLVSDLIDHFKQQAYGTIFDTITTKTFRDTSINRPPVDIMNSFHSLVQPIMLRILNNTQQSSTLASLRDVLLPRLISGQLRVREAERFLVEAGL